MLAARGAAAAAVLGLGVLLGGCAGVDYYAQATAGALDLLAGRIPIDTLIEDPATPPALARRLATAQQVRDFAVRELALPEGGSYRSFVALDRDYVVWSLVVAPPLSLVPEPQCFLLVGCLSYRGYFRLESGARAARAARARGMDVYLAPVPAYSTLGWFDDPLLSSSLRGSDVGVARLIFHELAHERLYLSGDTAFNEAYASAVAEAGVERWLAQHGSESQRQRTARADRRRGEMLELTGAARDTLQAVYTSGATEAVRRRRKQQVLRELREGYAELRRSWGGYPGYDRWFGQDLNNAKLALLSTYSELVPGFLALLDANDGDLARFHRAAGEFQRLPAARRRALLLDCARGRCSPSPAQPPS